jgi:hypothetical protein
MSHPNETERRRARRQRLRVLKALLDAGLLDLRMAPEDVPSRLIEDVSGSFD